MRTIQLTVEGMRCRHCVRQATAMLRDIPGIATVSADPSTSRISITGDVSEDDVLQAFTDTTFAVRIDGRA
jgi:copper chaperone CopZ